MTEQTALESTPLTASREHPVANMASVKADVDIDLLSWIHEAQRLFEEAEMRLLSGNVMPALSSLAAVSPLHGMLMGRCSEMLERVDDDSPDIPTGLYL